MKHVLILSITIFGCTQCIAAAEEKPGAIKKARTESISPRASVTWEGIFGIKPASATQSQSPVVQSLAVGRFPKKDSLAPIEEVFEEVAPIVTPSVLAVVFETYKPMIPYRDTHGGILVSSEEVHWSHAKGEPLFKGNPDGSVRILAGFKCSKYLVFEVIPGAIEEVGADLFLLNHTKKDFGKKLVADVDTDGRVKLSLQ